MHTHVSDAKIALEPLLLGVNVHATTALNCVADEAGVQGLQYDAPTAAARIVEVIALEQRIRATAPVEVCQVVAPRRYCGAIVSPN
jgi:hypothetical protein